MNKINCPNCNSANEADLNFCLNCGTPLKAQPQPAVASNQPPLAFNSSASNSTANQSSKSSRNLAIFGGLGCLALALGAVAVLALLYYIGSTANNANQIASNAKTANANSRNAANRRAANTAANSASGSDSSNTSSTSQGSSNTTVSGNSDDNSNSDTISEEQAENLLAEQLGAYERQGAIIPGDSDDIEGEERVLKAVYAKGAKNVEVYLAEFPDADAAKSGYTTYFATHRTAAKVIKRQKVAGKNGNNGEFVIYSIKNNGVTQHETLFHAGKYAFQFVAPDQVTLTQFLLAFGNHAGTLN